MFILEYLGVAFDLVGAYMLSRGDNMGWPVWVLACSCLFLWALSIGANYVALLQLAYLIPIIRKTKSVCARDLG